MRVLVADQETDALEAIARAFEVDVATSKATCIDLLRANDFDVIVACERLTDGSGLELLSHVGQRWPNVIRILAIEPSRRALLRGRLGPFKLFETLAYPIDEEKLEAALTRAAEALGEDSVPVARPAPQKVAAPPAKVEPRRQAPPSRASSAGNAGSQDSRRPAARTTQTPSVPGSRNMPTPSRQSPGSQSPLRPGAASLSGSKRGAIPGQKLSGAHNASDEGPYPPLPKKGSKIVPLGSPDTTEYRILSHDYHEQHMPGSLPAHREDIPKKAPTLQEKATALATEAMAAVSEFVRSMKMPSSPPPKPTKAPPRKKR